MMILLAKKYYPQKAILLGVTMQAIYNIMHSTLFFHPDFNRRLQNHTGSAMKAGGLVGYAASPPVWNYTTPEECY